MRAFGSIDEYIRSFPPSTRRLLRQIRLAIREAAPEATEAISYGIPTFKLGGKNLVHFAGYEHHIGFYPGSAVIAKHEDQLSGYNTAKGTVQFPIDKPLPLALVRKLVQSAVARFAPPDPFAKLSAPARRALAGAGVTSARQVAKMQEGEIAGLHGMGPHAMQILRTLLKAHGMRFAKNAGS